MASIPEAEYAASARQLKPLEFNADEWVAIARSAGIKYITPQPNTTLLPHVRNQIGDKN